MMPNAFDHVIELLEDDEMESATQAILTESAEQQIIRSLGEVTLMNYLMKFEEYLDDHDVYLFSGWDEAKVISRPKIDKFWATFYLLVGAKTDLRGAMRVKNDKEGQNKVSHKKLEDGHVIKFKILKRYLDQIEQRNKEKAEELSREEMGKTRRDS